MLGEPQRGGDSTARENRSVFGAVPDLNPLALAGKDHQMIARNRSAAQAGKADRPFGACAGQPGTVRHARFGKGDTAPGGGGVAEQQGGARGGVDLVAMVHLGDFNVPIGPQPRRRFAHQFGEQGDTERDIARLQHRDFGCGDVDQRVMRWSKSGGADQDRRARLPCRGKRALQRCRRRKIDQHVSIQRQHGGIATRVDSSSQCRAQVGHYGGKRLAHSARAADNPDCGHRTSPDLLRGGSTEAEPPTPCRNWSKRSD